MDKEYKILRVEERNQWSGTHGTFQDYALQLEGIDGWVALTQKPETEAPQVGGTLFGHTFTQTSKDKTFLKFKKVNPQYNGEGSGNSSPSGLVGDGKTLDYIVQMLEELTGRRDRLPTDKELEEPIDLSEIPF
jgi:hypothetical protein